MNMRASGEPTTHKYVKDAHVWQKASICQRILLCTRSRTSSLQVTWKLPPKVCDPRWSMGSSLRSRVKSSKQEVETSRVTSTKEVQISGVSGKRYGLSILGLWGRNYDWLSPVTHWQHHATLLRQLREEIKKLRSGFLLLQDNAPVHTSQVVVAAASNFYHARLIHLTLHLQTLICFPSSNRNFHIFKVIIKSLRL